MATDAAQLTRFWRERPLLTKVALLMFIVAMFLFLAVMVAGIVFIVYDKSAGG